MVPALGAIAAEAKTDSSTRIYLSTSSAPRTVGADVYAKTPDCLNSRSFQFFKRSALGVEFIGETRTGKNGAGKTRRRFATSAGVGYGWLPAETFYAVALAKTTKVNEEGKRTRLTCKASTSPDYTAPIPPGYVPPPST